MKSVSITVYGNVQGVYFRQFTKQKAEELSITGWVRNMEGGEVFMKLTGLHETLEEMERWCYKGSPQSVVDRVIVKNIELIEFDKFEIRF